MLNIKLVIDYIAKNPKALRLRYNKQLKIFLEKYGVFGQHTITKEPDFINLFKKLPIEEKISYLDFVLSSSFLQEKAKKDPVNCFFSMLNILEKRVNEHILKEKMVALRKKYNNNADKIIIELKRFIKEKYSKSDSKLSPQLNKLEYIFKNLDKEARLHLLETIYIQGMDHPVTSALITSYLEHAGIKNQNGTFNN